MKSRIKRVALSTGGGDAPGLNAVINAATLAARNRDWEVVGIRDGFNGLLFPDDYPDGGLVELTRDRVRGIIHKGGTISAPPIAATRSPIPRNRATAPGSRWTGPKSSLAVSKSIESMR